MITVKPTRFLSLGAAFLMFAGASSGADPTDPERTAAVRRTATTNLQCNPRRLGAYYWEIGRSDGAVASGRVSAWGAPDAVDADTTLNIASASKWVYAGMVLERDGDDPAARRYLNLTSGYSNFRTSNCPVAGTVAECDPGSRSLSEAVGQVFHYDGGHMQRHAIDTGLGPLDAAGLSAYLASVLGPDIGMEYRQPGLAGGIETTPRHYGAFLRRLLTDAGAPLQLGALLGSNPVCTFPDGSCKASRLTAIPEAWHYSIGHWIEDDPATTPVENIAFSSPGSFGFYPWVDATRTTYGMLARQTKTFTGVDEGYASVKCGRLLRLAWITGIPQ
jgi:CubicO group peptidase (beta-lactamase class C family)